MFYMGGCETNRESPFRTVPGNFLVVQELRLFAFIVGSAGSIPGGGAKVSHATWHSQKERECVKVKVVCLMGKPRKL